MGWFLVGCVVGGMVGAAVGWWLACLFTAGKAADAYSAGYADGRQSMRDG